MGQEILEFLILEECKFQGEVEFREEQMTNKIFNS